MPANGGHATQITRNGGLEAQESLDGKLLYVAKASADKLRAIDSRTVGGTPGGVWSMPVGGGPETLVLASVTFGSWSVASPGIFFIDFTGAQGSLGSKPVRFYEFATKKVTQVALIEKKVTWGNMEFSVTRDGGRLLWSQIDHESDDIMLVRGWKP